MQVLCFLISAAALPRLIATAWESPSLDGKQLPSAFSHVARDRDRMAQRLDSAIRGLILGKL
ncbi:MAG: hypothetical protein M3O41_07135 [Pseudomonadota bacterium]|nr:hypothetical protein [Pseudomonadota bacterium]